MDDRHRIQLETTEGARTAASGGERILIGLALLTLLGGALIAISNLVGVDLEASATGTPQPSVEASATPRPTRSPAPRRQMVLEPGEPSSPTEDPFGYTYWIRAEEDLPVRGSPTLDSAVSFTIEAGEAAFAYEQPPDDGLGWMQLQTPYSGSWVATRADGRDLVRRYLQEPTPVSAWVGGIAPGPRGFVAVGATSGNWNEPLSKMLASSDGARWSDSSNRQLVDVASAAWGPAGWLAITSGGDRPSASTWVHRSNDGLSWELLGRLPVRYDYLCCFSLVGSEFGYLLTSAEWGSQEIWFSAEGTAWREMADLPGGRGSGVRVAAVPDGFYAWSHEQDRVVGAAFTVNGRDWTEVVGGPTGGEPRIAELDGRIVGLDSGMSTGAARVWIGSISSGSLAWRRVPGADAAFTGAVVNSLVSDGIRAYAFGWERSTGDPLTWVGDGAEWVQAPLPATFDGFPTVAAAGPAGVVVVGSRPTMRGDNPIFWHLADDGSWRPEPSPFFAVARDRPPHCGSLPTDLLEFQVLDRIAAIACFGSSPITFRAWSAPCDWCGEQADQPFQPEWLANAAVNVLRLSPLQSRDYTAADGVLPPALPMRPEWVEAWVEVTGHFDDPAATTCTYDPPASEQWYPGPWWVVNDCRQRFVLDSVTVVDGP